MTHNKHTKPLADALIELPFPDKILWPNGRGHRMKKHRLFQAHKAWAHGATLAAIGIGKWPTDQRVSWTVTMYPKTKNAIDDDNARGSLKAYQDGIALALGIDDKLFDAPRLQFGEPVKGGKVVVALA